MRDGDAYWLAEMIEQARARERIEMRPRRTYGETKEEFRMKVAAEFDPHAMTELAELMLSVDRLDRRPRCRKT